MSLPPTQSGVAQRVGTVREWVVRRLVGSRDGGPAVVVGLGLGHLAVATWNFISEIQELSLDIGPIVAALLVGSVSLAVCLLGAWLWRGELPAEERWLVALGSVIGALVVGSIVYLSVVIRLVEGRVVGEPVFVLSLASSQGALSGAMVSVLYAQSRREAAAARRRKDQMEFVTGILRHDVLNSAMVIKSRAEMIGNGETDNHSEFADAIVARSEKVIDLSERTKEVVSVVASDEALEREPVELAPVVDAQMTALRPETDAVTVDVDVAEVTVLADRLLDEVVGNLAENALEHGLDGEGTITITTETVGDRVQLRVADTGTGVPDDRKAEIFERGASSGDGGFGLFFVRTIVDHYGGDIWVEDRTDGSGAVFVVELDRA